VRQTDLLHHYARTFDTVELDTTFHAIPRGQVVASWRGTVPDGFLFSAKLPRVITHMKRLRNVEEDLDAFLAALAPLREHTGVLLAQLPPDFHADNRDALEGFLRLAPREYRWAIEVRHRSWISPSTFDLLSEYGAAWAIVDIIGMPVVPEVTARFAYVRWLGDRATDPLSDTAEVDRAASLDRWAATLRDLSYRVDHVYGYFSDTWGGHAPASVRAMQQRLDLRSLTASSESTVVQPSLFPDLNP
jgi:uncharacterized protein YecE (DUF72 family)